MELQQNSNPYGKLFLVIGMVVLGAVLGAMVSAIYFQGKIKKLKQEYSTAQTVAPEAGGDLSALPNVPEPPKMEIPDEIFDVSGTVEKVGENTLTVKDLFFGEEKIYTIKVTENTKIVKAEMLENPPEPKEGEEIASPFKEEEASFSDIKEGDNVLVGASENVKDKTEFEATFITIEVMNLPIPPETPETPETSETPETPETLPAPESPGSSETAAPAAEIPEEPEEPSVP